MRRSEQTAEAIPAEVRALQVDVLQDADLNECDFHGLFAGLGEDRIRPGHLEHIERRELVTYG